MPNLDYTFVLRTVQACQNEVSSNAMKQGSPRFIVLRCNEHALWEFTPDLNLW